MTDEEKQGAPAEVEGQQDVATPVSDGGQPLVEQDPDQVALMRELLDDAPEPEADETVLPPGEDADEGAPTRIEKPEKPVPEVEEKADADKAKVEEPEAEAKEPSVKTFEYEHKGRRVALDVDPETFEVLDAMRNSAQQFPHLQGKYANVLEQLANTGGAGAPTEAGVPDVEQKSQGPSSVEDIARMSEPEYIKQFEPLVESLKDQGYFGEDGEFAEAFPRLATTIALIEHVGVPALATLEKVSSGWFQMAEKAEMEMFFNKLNTSLDEVAKRPGFEALKEPQNRKRLYQRLQKLNIDPGEVFEEDFLAGEWRAVNHSQASELERVAAERAAKKRDQSLSRSRGARGGAGGRGAVPPASSEGDAQQKLMRKLLEP